LPESVHTQLITCSADDWIKQVHRIFYEKMVRKSKKPEQNFPPWRSVLVYARTSTRSWPQPATSTGETMVRMVWCWAFRALHCSVAFDRRQLCKVEISIGWTNQTQSGRMYCYNVEWIQSQASLYLPNGAQQNPTHRGTNARQRMHVLILNSS
jgi:hypothetical protein